MFEGKCDIKFGTLIYVKIIKQIAEELIESFVTYVIEIYDLKNPTP